MLIQNFLLLPYVRLLNDLEFKTESLFPYVELLFMILLSKKAKYKFQIRMSNWKSFCLYDRRSAYLFKYLLYKVKTKVPG